MAGLLNEFDTQVRTEIGHINTTGDILTNNTIVTFKYWNWVGNKYKWTFMFVDGKWVGTDDNVSVSKSDLDNKYKFKITKIGCKDFSSIVKYGDKIQLRSLNNRYVQCGAGTCSTVEDAGNCDQDWQTFQIMSADGKSGNVKLGDPIQIRQVTGTNCSITAAGSRTTWCVDGQFGNSLIVILPKNGSIAKDPKKELDLYVKSYRDRHLGVEPTSSDYTLYIIILLIVISLSCFIMSSLLIILK